jgi:hypothetical protein
LAVLCTSYLSAISEGSAPSDLSGTDVVVQRLARSEKPSSGFDADTLPRTDDMLPPSAIGVYGYVAAVVRAHRCRGD